MVELPRVTFIVGLCGAGKSGLANELNDPFQVHDGFWDPAERRASYQLLVNAVRQGQSATVTEIAFCTQDNRDEILRWLKKDLPDLVPEFIFFDNDVAQSNKNCRDRAEAQVEINKRLTKSYIIPSGADRRKVWSDPRPVEPDDPETLYTQEEIDLIRMPLTTDILLSAFRNATGALALFGSDVLQPEVARIPNPSDQENAIAITLYRLLAYLKTCYELGSDISFNRCRRPLVPSWSCRSTRFF